MTDRYDICTGREDRDGKTRWTKIGVMFPAKSGEGFAIKLEALPLPNKDGEVWIKAFVPTPKEDASRAPARAREGYPDGINGFPQQPRRQAGGMSDLGDDVPFMWEGR